MISQTLIKSKLPKIKSNLPNVYRKFFLNDEEEKKMPDNIRQRSPG